MIWIGGAVAVRLLLQLVILPKLGIDTCNAWRDSLASVHFGLANTKNSLHCRLLFSDILELLILLFKAAKP